MPSPLLKASCLILALGTFSQGVAAQKPEVWLEVRSPHFVVVSNAGEKQARSVAGHFERIRSVFRIMFPNLHADSSAAIVVLAAKNQKTFDALLPESRLTKSAAKLAGLYMAGGEKNYALLRLDAPGENRFETVYHEYTHSLLHKIPAPLPPWLDEGLAQFYGNSDILEKQILLGRVDLNVVRYLRDNRLLPLPTLFNVTHSSPYYNEKNKINIFYAESWALVHMIMLKYYNQNRNPLDDYFNQIIQKKDPQAAGVAAFGDLDKLQDELQRYINSAGLKYLAAKTPTEVDDQSFPARELSPAESDAVRGDILVANQRYADARELLTQALSEDPKNAQACESMGYMEFQQKHTEEAKKWFSQAVALDSKSYLAHYFYATMRMQELKNSDLEDEIGTSLRKAIEINPRFAPAYNNLAWFYHRRRENLAEAYRMALTAIGLDPANVHFRMTAADILIDLGRGRDAVSSARLALTFAKTPAEIAAAQSVLANAQKYEQYVAKMQSYNQQIREAQKRESQQGAGESHEGSEDLTPPKLRRRGEGTTGAGESAGGGSGIQAPARHIDPAQRGARHTLDGKIEEVKCSPPTSMELTIAFPTKTLKLYSENYYTVQYSALNFTLSGELFPCRDLKGMKAQIAFYDLKDKPDEGELISVQLRK